MLIECDEQIATIPRSGIDHGHGIGLTLSGQKKRGSVGLAPDGGNEGKPTHRCDCDRRCALDCWSQQQGGEVVSNTETYERLDYEMDRLRMAPLVMDVPFVLHDWVGLGGRFVGGTPPTLDCLCCTRTTKAATKTSESIRFWLEDDKMTTGLVEHPQYTLLSPDVSPDIYKSELAQSPWSSVHYSRSRRNERVALNTVPFWKVGKPNQIGSEDVIGRSSYKPTSGGARQRQPYPGVVLCAVQEKTIGPDKGYPEHTVF